ncbi:hypothetical protein FEM48_Zijuj07G0009200 [Ziziphus jujuba var. spinosa]|uniref:Uncharacterized protein n=1 Tax=Ziziphus jujuba var. spinosa TaxID=714518 RepID=A0A978V1H8_ZIZJJ|nr:hypothetical protein FEM48_Zijuj07G0009200 [Ziziphus jujuba var. spinosa]
MKWLSQSQVLKSKLGVESQANPDQPFSIILAFANILFLLSVPQNMENLALFISICLMFNIIMIITSPFPSFAASTCGVLVKPPTTAMEGKCKDNPDNIGTHTCTGGGSCKPFGTLVCSGKSYPKYNCSPPISVSTRAILRNNDFSEGGIGGGPSACDSNYHDNKELVVALSTGWYNRGFDMREDEHGYQGPCGHNVVNGSDGVWRTLGLDTDDEGADVTWSMS